MQTTSLGIHNNTREKMKPKTVCKESLDLTGSIATSSIASEFKSCNCVKNSNILRPSILGSIDGLITSFVIIAGGIAGNVSKNSVVLIGFSSLFADAFSMGTSEYLSSRTETSVSQSLLLGFSCFISFICFGIIPLVGYSVASSETEFIVCVSLFFASLVFVSIIRSLFTKTLISYSVLETILLGSFAGGIAYSIAYFAH